jgi:Xaa-Pro dipeptidase
MHKDESEVAAMRTAVRMAESALQAALPYVKPGVSEKDIAAELTLQVLRAGSDAEMPFSPIVSGGPNSANPHAVPTQRKLQPGDLLVIDWGAASEGYFSDLTRTFEPAAELRSVAQTVLQANQAGRQAARPGVLASQVDAAARQVIAAAGYGQYFTHRTGHGLGLDSHEEPYLRADNHQPLARGMTFTVEPGIYLPDRNGVRIEDNLVITADGAETLSSLPRELIVLE